MSNNLKILIADYSAVVLERVSLKISEIERVEVIGLAKNTPEAISLFDSLKPDAVILDLHMPGGGGLNVLRYIKGRRPDVTVLMMTTFPYAHYREVSAQGGADFFMDKSNDIGKIVKVINDLARSFIKQDEG